LATADAAQVLGADAVTNYVNAATTKTEAALLTELKALYNEKIRQTAYKASKTAACLAITGGVCIVGDGVNELTGATWTTAAFAAYDTKKGQHDAAVAELAVLQGKKLVLDYDKQRYTDLKAA
jgi:hypothetical protein